MKIKIISIAITILFISNIFPANQINFELWNKTESEIHVALDLLPMYSRGVRDETEWNIRSGEKLPMHDVNTKAESSIIITQNGNSKKYTIGPCYLNCYQTIYLSYDQTGLRPQKGKLRGWLGITDSGYDNSNNVTREFIKGN